MRPLGSIFSLQFISTMKALVLVSTFKNILSSLSFQHTNSSIFFIIRLSVCQLFSYWMRHVGWKPVKCVDHQAAPFLLKLLLKEVLTLNVLIIASLQCQEKSVRWIQIENVGQSWKIPELKVLTFHMLQHIGLNQINAFENCHSSENKMFIFDEMTLQKTL